MIPERNGVWGHGKIGHLPSHTDLSVYVSMGGIYVCRLAAPTVGAKPLWDRNLMCPRWFHGDTI